MIRCESVRSQAGLYALGALDEADGADLEAHLDGCPDCWRDFASLRQVAGVVAYGLAAEELPRDLKARLFRRIEQDVPRTDRTTRPLNVDPVVLGLPPQPVTKRSWQLPVLAGALMLALVWGGWQQVRAGQEQARQAALAAALQDQEALQQRSMARIRELSRDRAHLDLLKAQDVRVVDLAGQKAAPEAAAKLVWSQQEDSWRLTVENLPPAPSKQTYQIWAATAKQKVHLGVFQTQADGTAAIKAFLPVLDGNPLAAMVTVEPAGGSQQPTGDLVLMGVIE